MLVEVADAEATRELLAAACGVRCVVKKRREVYLHRFVRIHLDQVETLGEFIEFEAMLRADVDELDAQRVLEDLMQRFNVSPKMLLGASYGDLL
jgi:predicted adenylyl cyclase CyaB